MVATHCRNCKGHVSSGMCHCEEPNIYYWQEDGYKPPTTTSYVIAWAFIDALIILIAYLVC